MHYVLFQIDILIRNLRYWNLTQFNSSMECSLSKRNWKLWQFVLRIRSSNWITEFRKQRNFGSQIPKGGCVCLIIDRTKCHDVGRSLDINVLFKFSSPKNTKWGIFSQGFVEHLVITFKLYQLDPSVSSIFVVSIQEMGEDLFTSSNSSVGRVVYLGIDLHR